MQDKTCFNPLNAELNPICHLLALLGAHPILHVSGIRVKQFVLWYIVLHAGENLHKIQYTLALVKNEIFSLLKMI